MNTAMRVTPLRHASRRGDRAARVLPGRRESPRNPGRPVEATPVRRRAEHRSAKADPQPHMVGLEIVGWAIGHDPDAREHLADGLSACGGKNREIPAVEQHRNTPKGTGGSDQTLASGRSATRSVKHRIAASIAPRMSKSTRPASAREKTGADSNARGSGAARATSGAAAVSIGLPVSSRTTRFGADRVHRSEAPAAAASAQPLAGHVAQKAAVVGPRAASRAAHRLSGARKERKLETRRYPRGGVLIETRRFRRHNRGRGTSVAQYEVFERPFRLILDWQVERWRLNRQQELVAAVAQRSALPKLM